MDEAIDWLLEQEKELRQKAPLAMEQLRALRDLRWDLMTLRAETEDSGDAPVFDNPQDLLHHLRECLKS
jgi:hypothetical protein